MSRPFRHAKNELQAAQATVDRMRAAQDFDEFEIAWRNFLTAVEKAWVKVERVCKAAPGFQQWQKSYKDLRAADPLLVFVYHARHVDQHTVAEMMTHTPGTMTLNPMQPAEALFIEHLEMHGGQLVSYRGNQPLLQTITPPRTELLDVNNRNTIYAVPTSHRGQVLLRNGPLDVATLALSFYREYTSEAEKRFGALARA